MENSHPDSMNQLNRSESPTDSAIPQGWETVNFPGQVPIVENLPPNPDPEKLVKGGANRADQSLAKTPKDSTGELLQLVQDLNQCNDVLLARVSELEEALEKSQAALQAEVERNQVAGAASELRPEQQPDYVQKQVAHLLSELEIANDGLRRTTIHNDTLQAELEASQQRVAQLERECTLLQQRFSEKNIALQKAEDSCRDLKARLHRQQRYTLQFKAALEKCLSMSSEPAQGPRLGISGHDLGGGAPAQPISMPKTPQIQPWSKNDSKTEHDPGLDHLLRNLKSAGQGPTVTSTMATGAIPHSAMEQRAMFSSDNSSAKATDPDAEALLWHDLERVIETPGDIAKSSGISHSSTDTAEPSVPEAGKPTPDGKQTDVMFTEPSPWGAPIPEPAAAQPTPTAAEAELETLVTEPIAPSTSDTAYERAEEPAPQTYQHQEQVGLPPYLKSSGQGAPSPLVYPLRPQKKLKSLAAVQLPSFGKSVRQH
jgi:hypothetical protein